MTVMEVEKGYRKALWSEEEDRVLMDHIMLHGKGKWNQVAKITGLKRCGKSCRLRWINYLSPNVKRGDFSEQEEDLIIRLHKLLGNRWSLIAGRVPGRTDNQVKNHWNTHLSKKLGIKKKKFKLVCASPKTCQSEVERNHRVASELNSEEPVSAKCGAGDGPKGTVGFSGINEDENESSFWLSIDHLNPSTPGLMEFTDTCSLDFVWHGL